MLCSKRAAFTTFPVRPRRKRLTPDTAPNSLAALIHGYSRFFNSSTSATAYCGEAEGKPADMYKLLALVYTPGLSLDEGLRDTINCLADDLDHRPHKC